ncbi:MAG TPA: hypothetical protein PKE55_04685 [Kiritimatiellia bacterium]|nr:hypothetical protein [Kiritimatiellia bacterium]
MKTISVRELKARWAMVEEQVGRGETFEVLNRGKPTVRIVPATPRRVLVWDDHLSTAAKAKGISGSELIVQHREDRL